ncbi:FtsX-like permease family protein [Microbacterium sp. NPDC019599]|uniref:ABC transporter permease n=1 Tax=Microbacterium sp. NPDC019599 TaxID=3154690 RepID=UPI0033F98294
MLLLLARDMQWRWRRLVAGVIATALVLAVTLLLGALRESFLAETERTIAFFGGDVWVVPGDTAGPFTSNSPIAASVADDLRAHDDVDDATPVAIFRHAVEGIGDGFTDVSVIAYEPGGVVEPVLQEGRAPAATGETAVDERTGARMGDRITLAGDVFTVVGIMQGFTMYGGTPGILLTLEDAQRTAYGGEALASAVVVAGSPDDLPDGLIAQDPDQIGDDLRRPLAVVTGALGVLELVLWIVAAAIVGLLAYLSSLDRQRDVTVFKALGVSSGRLVVIVLAEGVVTAVLGAGVGLVLGIVLVPLFPIDVAVSPTQAVVLLGLAVVVGMLAGSLGIRRVLRADPARAFAALD